jgi:uncharacterized protein YggE
MLKTTRAALLAAALFALPQAAQAEDSTLSLSAEGFVRAVPDTAVVTIGVVEQADTAGDALTANNAAMNRLFEALRGAGIADRDMGTSNFSIDPVMIYPEPKADGTQDPPEITGYRVSNQVTVKIREIGRAGGILDQVVRVGANQISGIAFTVADEASLLDKARAEAMRTVIARAKIYAQAGGFTIGRIVSVSENTGFYPVQAAPMAAMAEAKDARVPIAPGEQRLQVTVNVSWEIHENR